MHSSIPLCLLSAVVYAWQTAAHPSTAEMQVKKLKVNDVELAYVEEGKGETAVFVHGGISDWRSWESLRPFMSGNYHFVSLSRRYHYPNPWTDEGRKYSRTQHVEDLAAFIRALKVGKAHLVGNSYGGGLVAHVALKYPELLRSVIIGEAGLIPPTSAEGKAAVAAMQADREKVVAAVKAGDPKQAAILLYDTVVDEPGAFHKLPPERQQRILDNAKTIGLEQVSDAIPITCEELGALRIPALVVRGEKTRANFRYGVEALLGCLPKTTELAIIPGAHHAWNMANPEASAKAILNFIDKH
jgi:non-heme chloroperoxidase